MGVYTFERIHINTWGPGELQKPQAVALTQNWGNAVIATANRLISSGEASGTLIVALSPLGDAQNAFSVTNAGVVAIGDSTNAGQLSVIGPIIATGKVQGDNVNNLIIDAGTQVLVFQVAGVQKGFIDVNGLTMNNPIFLTSTSKISSQSGTNLVIDTLTTGDSITLSNNGTPVMQIANNRVSVAQVLQPNAATTSVAGSVAGTVVFSAPIWGTGLKVLIVEFNDYRSTGVAAFNFPSSMTSGVFICGNIGNATFSLFSGSSAQNVSIIKTLGTRAAVGTNDVATSVHANSFGFFNTSAGQIQIGPTGGALRATLAIIGA